ncbi:hypothetical protein NL676_039306 [Syzygium grande]|nr:hypothetical protein NL676_039306 [Syzygium grande]
MGVHGSSKVVANGGWCGHTSRTAASLAWSCGLVDGRNWCFRFGRTSRLRLLMAADFEIVVVAACRWRLR